jgi:uncharacterized membrane protein
MTPETPTASPNHPNSKTLAAVAYILTWVTGLIILFTAPKDDRYARWHAIQAIGLGVAVTVLWIIYTIVLRGMLGPLVWIFQLLVIVVVIVLAVKAYQGDGIRLPVVGDMADKNA